MSVLQFIEGYMSGNAWEDLCVMCYRMRYQDEHYTPISAAQGGDGGIEGLLKMELFISAIVLRKIIQMKITTHICEIK